MRRVDYQIPEATAAALAAVIDRDMRMEMLPLCTQNFETFGEEGVAGVVRDHTENLIRFVREYARAAAKHYIRLDDRKDE